MRYYAYRLPGREFLHGAVPLRDVHLHRELLAPQALEAVLDRATAFQDLVVEGTGDSDGLLRDNGTLILADDGRKARGYIVDLVTPDDTRDDRVRISAAGPFNLSSDQPWLIRAFNGVEEDPADIFRRIWDYLSTAADGFEITVDQTKTPVRIGEEERPVEFQTQAGDDVAFDAGPYRLNWWDTENLKERLDSLAEETPFEWAEETRFNREDDSPPTFHLRLGYPVIEAIRRENLHFNVDVNVFSPVFADEVEFFSEVLVVGNGEGSAKKRGSAAKRNHGRVRRVKRVTDQSIRSNRHATEVAKKLIAQNRPEERFIESCVVIDHPAAPLGSFDLGDIITVKGQFPWGTHTQDCRISGIDHAVAEARQTLTFERLPE